MRTLAQRPIAPIVPISSDSGSDSSDSGPAPIAPIVRHTWERAAREAITRERQSSATLTVSTCVPLHAHMHAKKGPPKKPMSNVLSPSPKEVSIKGGCFAVGKHLKQKARLKKGGGCLPLWLSNNQGKNRVKEACKKPRVWRAAGGTQPGAHVGSPRRAAAAAGPWP